MDLRLFLIGLMTMAISCSLVAPDIKVIELDTLAVESSDDSFLVRYSFQAYEVDWRESVARCLTERGVVLYSMNWCGACRQQLDLFGPYAELLTIVNCSVQGSQCRTAGIRSVPTWVFPDRSRLVGVRSLAELARRGRCI
jgi:hypothetical protein